MQDGTTIGNFLDREHILVEQIYINTDHLDFHSVEKNGFNNSQIRNEQNTCGMEGFWNHF